MKTPDAAMKIPDAAMKILGAALRPLGAAVVSLTMIGSGAALAQDASTNQVAAKTAWSVFTEQTPRECWTVSAPTETVNTKGGNVVAVRRGEILFMTFFRPDAGVRGQVAFTGGYPFADGSTVGLQVGTDTFDLYTEKEWAWPASSDDDAKIITALKRGSDAVLTARSSRGTQTKDTFSLIGYTAAMDEAQKRCQ
jgi:invasion protein IalB